MREHPADAERAQAPAPGVQPCPASASVPPIVALSAESVESKLTAIAAVAASVVVLLLGAALFPQSPSSQTLDVVQTDARGDGGAKPPYIIIDEPREEAAFPQAPRMISTPAEQPLPQAVQNTMQFHEITRGSVPVLPVGKHSIPIAPIAPHEVEGSRATATTTARAHREGARSTPTRLAQPRRVALMRDIHVGCRQDQMFTREVCKAIRCASTQFANHPICVRRITEQRALDARRELHGGN